MDTVTKPKSEGRIAAGKRLVEWNRKNKEDLLKNKDQVASSDNSSKLSSEQQPISNLSSNSWQYAVPIIVFVVGAAGIYFYYRKPKIPKVDNNDIFCMN